MKIQRREIRKQVSGWLAEDMKTGDITSQSTIAKSQASTGMIRSKQALVVCGVEIAREVFRQVDPGVKFTAKAKDGQRVEVKTVLAVAKGSTRSILAAERTALNILQHLSGIATLTGTYVEAVRGTKAKILDTRKTTPGLRSFEKYAVAKGGGTNHRMGLWDMVLIKDNHIQAAGSITRAVSLVKAKKISPKKIQVEVTGFAELEEALSAGAGLIMLDNMTPAKMRKAVEITDGRALLEASGNVNLRRVRAIAETGVDRISIGALTHSAPAVDIHMMIEDS